MNLSVIIPTRNRANLLEKTLISITKQSLERSSFEVLVIDNGSTDQTKSVVARFEEKLNARYIYDGTPGLHVGRHKGMFSARTNNLVFCDDDIEAFPTWLEAINESFKDNSVVMVGGKNLPLWESAPPKWLECLWNRPMGMGKALGALSILDFGDNCFDMDPGYIWGCNFSIRKNVLLEAGGFHPDGMPGELIKFRGDGEAHVTRFVKNKRYIATYNPNASVHHFVPNERMTYDYFKKRAFQQAISDSYAKVRFSEKDI